MARQTYWLVQGFGFQAADAGLQMLGCRLSTRVHRVDFVDQPFVGIPFDAVGVDLAFESLRVQDYWLAQKPFVATNVKL